MKSNVLKDMVLGMTNHSANYEDLMLLPLKQSGVAK